MLFGFEELVIWMRRETCKDRIPVQPGDAVKGSRGTAPEGMSQCLPEEVTAELCLEGYVGVKFISLEMYHTQSQFIKR